MQLALFLYSFLCVCVLMPLIVSVLLRLRLDEAIWHLMLSASLSFTTAGFTLGDNYFVLFQDCLAYQSEVKSCLRMC